ncbi:MAG: hypothetical protein WBY88_02870 [Desulfosarcina sp.]
MDAIKVKHEYFTCHQVEGLAVLKIVKGAKKFFISVGGKEALVSTLQTIGDLKTIKGVDVIYFCPKTQYQKLSLKNEV